MEVRDIHAVLKQYWGYDAFRPVQEQIIRSVLEGRDTLALMPTGGGKSLTYQVPTMARQGLCIVVTPLIALMKDQVDRLRALHIPAVAVHSGLSPRQIDIALDNCAYGDVKFLYVAPERLSTDAFRLRVERMKVTLLAVDEAHCISQWGYDFRPSYLRIAELRRQLPGVPVLALTASATPLVAEDIMRHLDFAEPHILRSSFARPNLSYSVRRTEDKNGQLLRLLRGVEGCGIVYVRTREGTEQLADLLRNEGITAAAYHGGLGHAERTLRQEDWMTGRVRVMVATNAFGMGIDKADVRFVCHYSLCDSLESYYQEAGRAGRDGRRSYALLLVAPNDESRVVRRFEQEFPPLDRIKEIYDKVCSYLQIGIGEGAGASFLFNIHDFCTREHLYVGTVQSALKLLQQNGYLTLTDAMENPARLMFCVSRDDLYRLRIRRDDLDHFIRTILRLYNGVFTEFRPIDECELATWSGYKVERVKELLKTLWQLRVIRYIPSNRSPMLYMEEERLPRADLYIAPETYRHRQELMRERFDHMLAYAANETECRSVVLELYFGADDAQPCGICDICLARRRETKRQQASTAPTAPNAPADSPAGNPSAHDAAPTGTTPGGQASTTPRPTGTTPEGPRPAGSFPTGAAPETASEADEAEAEADSPTGSSPTRLPIAAAEGTIPTGELRRRVLELLSSSPCSPQELLDALHSELPGALFVDEGPVIELLRRLQAQGVLRTEADGRLHTVLAQP